MKKLLPFFLLMSIIANVMSQKLSLFQLDNSSNLSNPIAAIRYNGKLYLGLNDGIHGNELFVFKDNTIELIQDINSGLVDSYANNFRLFNQKFLFTANNKMFSYNDIKNEIEIISNNMQYPNYFIEFNNKLFFNAFQPETGYELWVTNGDSNGTCVVKDIYEGGKLSDNFQVELNSSNPHDFLIYNNELLFLAKNDKGWNIWTTKGSINSTEIKVNLKNGASSMLVFNNKIFLLVYHNNSEELWTSDGTDLNTVLFIRIGENSEGIVTPPFKHYNKLFFFANDSIHGRELWVSDGTINGTNILLDINAGTKGSLELDGCHFISLSEKTLLFVANDGINGAQLWRSDGTKEGTALVKNIFNNPNTYHGFSEFIKFGNIVVFMINKGIQITEFWQTDGTFDGTYQIGEIDNSSTMTLPHFLYQEDNKLYFSGANKLWVCSDTTLTSVKSELQSDLFCYPNPVSESIFLKINYPSFVKLLDLNGKIKFNKFYNLQFSSLVDISVANIEDGMYIMQVISDKKEYYNKIIVKKK